MPNNPPTLLAKIDWYSFTVPTVTPLSSTGQETYDVINQALAALFGNALDALEPTGTWTLQPAKGFYSWRGTHVASRLAVSWGEVNAHVFVELPGQACTWAREVNVFDRLVKMTADRASRVDAAIDIVTATMPEQFVAAGHAARFSDSLGNIKSKTGDTYYVGSRKSDRCARIYRYAPPHPRSHLLRIEAEYKGSSARLLAGVLAAQGMVEAVRAAHAPFAWLSSELDPAFLQCPSFLDELRINRDMGNSDGSIPPFSPPYCGMNTTAFWTLDNGLARYLRQRWRALRL